MSYRVLTWVYFTINGMKITENIIGKVFTLLKMCWKFYIYYKQRMKSMLLISLSILDFSKFLPSNQHYSLSVLTCHRAPSRHTWIPKPFSSNTKLSKQLFLKSFNSCLYFTDNFKLLLGHLAQTLPLSSTISHTPPPARPAVLSVLYHMQLLLQAPSSSPLSSWWAPSRSSRLSSHAAFSPGRISWCLSALHTLRGHYCSHLIFSLFPFPLSTLRHTLLFFSFAFITCSAQIVGNRNWLNINQLNKLVH